MAEACRKSTRTLSRERFGWFVRRVSRLRRWPGSWGSTGDAGELVRAGAAQAWWRGTLSGVSGRSCTGCVRSTPSCGCGVTCSSAAWPSGWRMRRGGSRGRLHRSSEGDTYLPSRAVNRCARTLSILVPANQSDHMRPCAGLDSVGRGHVLFATAYRPRAGSPAPLLAREHAAVMPSPAIRARTRRSISSRMGRTAPTDWPALYTPKNGTIGAPLFVLALHAGQGAQALAGEPLGPQRQDVDRRAACKKASGLGAKGAVNPEARATTTSVRGTDHLLRMA